jgi:hypothetical protein
LELVDTRVMPSVIFSTYTVRGPVEAGKFDDVTRRPRVDPHPPATLDPVLADRDWAHRTITTVEGDADGQDRPEE